MVASNSFRSAFSKSARKNKNLYEFVTSSKMRARVAALTPSNSGSEAVKSIMSLELSPIHSFDDTKDRTWALERV